MEDADHHTFLLESFHIFLNIKGFEKSYNTEACSILFN